MCFLQAYKRWKGIELKLTDAANEANDNVRYLTTLERAFEVRLALYYFIALAWLLVLCCCLCMFYVLFPHALTVVTHMLLRTAMVAACRSCMAAALSRCWTACTA
jgi:hypothetical protein